MAMGQQKDRQGDLMVGWAEMPRSPGHVFYDRLQSVLIEGGFDAFAEASCRPYYAARMGAPSVPPGRYFRMHLVGYFEGIDSERGLEWRCSDSLSLREFLRLGSRERVPDHSWLSKTRARLPHEVHAAVFDWVLALIGEAGLVKGERIGVDASTMEANAALRNIVRRDTGEGYREMLEHLARESGIETPTAEDLARLDRKRKGKKLSNEDWVSKSDPEAKIAKMKDGTTHLAYKPEHAVDLDTGAVVAAELHPADEGDTTTLPKTLETAKENLASVDAAPTAEDPAECVTDKGYHSRAVLKALDNGPWKTRIAEPKQKGFARWRGDEAARRAVTNNRTRLLSGVAKEAFKLRAEIVERSFAHNLDRGGMRRTWLRGRENVHKRYLLHVAGHNLSLLMRQLIGAGTPREAVAGGYGGIFVLLTPTGAMLVALGVSQSGQTVFAAASSSGSESRKKPLNQRAVSAALFLEPAGHVWRERVQLIARVGHLLKINMLVMVGLECVRLVSGRTGVVRHGGPGSSGEFRRRYIPSRVPRIQKHQILHSDKLKSPIRWWLIKQDGGVHEVGVGAVAVDARLDRRDLQQFGVDIVNSHGPPFRR